MLPRPSTAQTRRTTATVFRLIVNRRASAGRVLRDRQTDPGHPGVYARDQIVPMLERDLGHHLDLSAKVQQEGPVADLFRTRTPGRSSDGFGDLVRVVRVDGVASVTSTTIRCGPDSTTSSAVSAPPRRPSPPRRQVGRRADRGRRLHPYGDRISGTRRGHRSSFPGPGRTSVSGCDNQRGTVGR